VKIESVKPTALPELNPVGNEGTAESPVNQIGQTFQQALDNLSQQQDSSDSLIQQLAAGENVDIHTVMIAADQTDINFRIAIAIRDKLVDAYQQVMRMGV
jgi:flagellar hook-basal body complex protein FliE